MFLNISKIIARTQVLCEILNVFTIQSYFHHCFDFIKSFHDYQLSPVTLDELAVSKVAEIRKTRTIYAFGPFHKNESNWAQKAFRVIIASVKAKQLTNYTGESINYFFSTSSSNSIFNSLPPEVSLSYCILKVILKYI